MTSQVPSIIDRLLPARPNICDLISAFQYGDAARLSEIDAAIAADMTLAVSIAQHLLQAQRKGLDVEFNDALGFDTQGFFEAVDDACDNLRIGRGQKGRVVYHVGRCPDSPVSTLGVEARRSGLVRKLFIAECPYPTLAAIWFCITCRQNESELVHLQPGWITSTSAAPDLEPDKVDVASAFECQA